MDKKVLYALITIFLLVGMILFQAIRYGRLNDRYDISVQNNKAYEAQLSTIKEENKVFQFSIEQLEYINDSTIHCLDSVRKELKIKDRQIQQMSKIKEKVYIHDSIMLYDTIFKESDFTLDTCLGDEWYQNCFHLQYPNEITSSINLNTETDCFIHTSRETINPPCKTWIGRLFQKKHTVINVTIHENNPYASVKESKFVKIVK
jgi:hypothetical protein